MKNENLITKIKKSLDSTINFNTEEELLKYKNGNLESREKLIFHWSNLAGETAKEYAKYADYEELLSVGLCALTEAVDSFKIKKNHKFHKYAKMVIESKVIDYIRTYYHIKSNDEFINEQIDKYYADLSQYEMDEINEKNIDKNEDLELVEQTLDFIKNNCSAKDYEIVLCHFGIENINKDELLNKYGITSNQFCESLSNTIEKVKNYLTTMKNL